MRVIEGGIERQKEEENREQNKKKEKGNRGTRVLHPAEHRCRWHADKGAYYIL